VKYTLVLADTDHDGCADLEVVTFDAASDEAAVRSAIGRICGQLYENGPNMLFVGELVHVDWETVQSVNAAMLAENEEKSQKERAEWERKEYERLRRVFEGGVQPDNCNEGGQ